jgi:signal transduction histidine kinase
VTPAQSKREMRATETDAGPQSYTRAIVNILEDTAGEKSRSGDTQRAILNILEDAEEEKTRLEATQKAILNILDDAAAEKDHLGETQRAILNILEDSAGEEIRFEATQKAILNILDDAAAEKDHLGETQRAVINILEDAEEEKIRLEATQKAILNILDDSAAEKVQLGETQRAVLNILEDFELEKTKVEKINADLRNEISERVRVEGALRQANAVAEAANKELEAFSYSVAHDLRAPLRSIDGFSQSLLEDCADQLDSDGKLYLQRVRQSAQRMAQIIDGLLNLSRVSRLELRRETVSLSEVARSVLARLKDARPDRDVECVISDGLIVQADPRLVDIVLTNLIGNAWKFTGRRATARIELATRGGHPQVYCVRDNGAGFDANYADKLFGVFQRLHGVDEFEGTGIGLATVQRIVRRHGGQVWAEGAVDRGATFFFTLEDSKGDVK